MKIETETKKGYEKYEFPFDESEVESILQRLPPEDLEGLEKIIITPPLKNEDFKRFGRYDHGKVYLFMHLKVESGFEIDLGCKALVLSLGEFKREGLQALLHEIGHYKGIRDFDDKSEDFATNYSCRAVLKYFPKFLE